MISTLVWNCRGMGSRSTRLHLREMIQSYTPKIVAVLEPRVHSSRCYSFFRNLGFSDMLIVEVLGYVGGIWLVWDAQAVTLDVVSMGDHVISVVVRESVGSLWLLTVVYASPQAHIREDLWQYV